jgi:hypothetical protein
LTKAPKIYLGEKTALQQMLLKKLEIERTYFSITEAVYDKPTGNNIANREKL